MAKKTYVHEVDLAVDENGKVVRVGKPKVVEVKKLPRHLRGYDENSMHTFTEGPIARLFGRPKKGRK